HQSSSFGLLAAALRRLGIFFFVVFIIVVRRCRAGVAAGSGTGIGIGDHGRQIRSGVEGREIRHERLGAGDVGRRQSALALGTRDLVDRIDGDARRRAAAVVPVVIPPPRIGVVVAPAGVLPVVFRQGIVIESVGVFGVVAM